MAKKNTTLHVTMYLTNAKALRALDYAARVLADAQESQPWNEDLTKAAKALRYAAKKIGIRMRGEGVDWRTD